jgi:hypothetical protein
MIVYSTATEEWIIYFILMTLDVGMIWNAAIIDEKTIETVSFTLKL